MWTQLSVQLQQSSEYWAGRVRDLQNQLERVSRERLLPSTAATVDERRERLSARPFSPSAARTHSAALLQTGAPHSTRRTDWLTPTTLCCTLYTSHTFHALLIIERFSLLIYLLQYFIFALFRTIMSSNFHFHPNFDKY